MLGRPRRLFCLLAVLCLAAWSASAAGADIVDTSAVDGVVADAEDAGGSCHGIPTTVGGGGPGNDTIDGTSSADSISGHRGDDLIRSHEGDDQVCGGHGNDTVYGGQGEDVIFGGPGDDYLNGQDGRDYVDGEGGNDTIICSTVNDLYCDVALSARNQIFDGYGNDRVDTRDGEVDDIWLCADGVSSDNTPQIDLALDIVHQESPANC